MNERQKQLFKILKKHSSKKQPIKTKEIIILMRDVKIKDKFICPKYVGSELRLDIGEIRRYNLFGKYWIISGNFGYYLSTSVKEIEAWANHYNGYIKEMVKNLKGIKKRCEFYNYKLDFTE